MEKANMESTTLLSVYDEDLKRLEYRIGKDRSVNTYTALRQGKRYLVAFLQMQMGREDISLNELTPQFINDFSVYLSAERGLRGGTVWLSCQQLKGVVKRAHQRGQLSWNPFAGFHIAKNIRPREYLTEEELGRLISHHFVKKSLAFARDLFVFSAFTGLSYIDIQELRPSDIVTIGTSTWITSKRHKTKTPYQVKLLDIPLHLLYKYIGNGSGNIFGKVEYRTQAKRIKQVMNEIGITRQVTMHCARHSFAVLAINKGMPIESLSRILGHTNITTTQIYARITMHKLELDITAFEEQLNV